jgi:hypothetical protein
MVAKDSDSMRKRLQHLRAIQQQEFVHLEDI